MKRIRIGSPTTITLDQADVPASKDVFLSIYDEAGNLVLDSTGAEIVDRKLDYGLVTKVYSKEITIQSTFKEQFVRLLFSSNDFNISEEYAPEDAKAYSTVVISNEIVPLQYFIDYILSVSSSADPVYRTAVTEYIKQNRFGLKSFLQSSQSDLEMATDLYFGETTLTEAQDNTFEKFTNHFWQMTVYHPPINSLVSVKLKFGMTEIANVGIELFKYNRMKGLIEFLPLPGGESAGIYNLLLSNMSAVGSSIMNGGLYGRIPDMFEYTYKTGLIYDGADPNEKEAIRQAVASRAFTKMINLVDGSGKITSTSESIDGVSKSISYGTSELLRRLNEQEKDFIKNITKRYAKEVNMVVV